MGGTKIGITTTLRVLATIVVVSIAAGRHPAAGMNQTSGAGTAVAQAGSDSISRFNEKILFYERSFRPSSYDLPLPADSGAPRSVSAPGDRAADTAPDTVQGFRIQVINTNSYEVSAATRTALLAAFDTWWVYVMFDAPTYRVRIGDFASRLEAKKALEQIQAKGFPSALLVPDKVILHLPPRLPLPAPIDSIMVH